MSNCPTVHVSTSGPPGPRGVQGFQGEVAVDSTVTGAPGTPALVEDLDSRNTHALLRFTVPEGIQGVRGTRWWLSNATTPDPPTVPNPLDGDQFLYQINGDMWSYNGTTAVWTKTGNIRGPIGPQGPTGSMGPQGQVIVRQTNTLPPGAPAMVTDVNPNPGVADLIFDIPQGPVGQTGPQGPQGIQGIQGVQGQVSVQQTITGAPGSAAMVQDVNANPGIADLVFTVPAGQTGPVGPQGPQGIQGVTGSAAVIIGDFTNRNPSELPPNGLLTAGWESMGPPMKPQQNIQATVGTALIYKPTGKLWSYVSTAAVPAGWIEVGIVVGPKGDQGATGPTGPVGPTGSQGQPGSDTVSVGPGVPDPVLESTAEIWIDTDAPNPTMAYEDDMERRVADLERTVAALQARLRR